MNQRLDQPTPLSSTGRNGSQPKEIKNAAKKAKSVASVATNKTENKSTEVLAQAPTTAVRLSAEERLRLTQQKAYFRAERRGFVGGDAVADWLEAEAEVNSRFPQ